MSEEIYIEAPPLPRGSAWEWHIATTTSDDPATAEATIYDMRGDLAAAIVATYAAGQLTVSIPASASARLKPGSYRIEARAGVADRKIAIIYLDVTPTKAAVRDDIEPPDPGGGGGNTPFTIQAGFVDNLAAVADLPAIPTSTAGTTVNLGPATAGQTAVLVFPAAHPPRHFNNQLGLNALGQYTLLDREAGGDYVYTRTGIRAGVRYTYVIDY